MAQPLYCWRCDMVLPMLDEEEWALLQPLLSSAISDLMKYRKENPSDPDEPWNAKLGQRALACYRAFTGFEETNINALHHHRLSLYGPPCAHCGKPLRTPQAKLCAACGTLRT